MVQLSHGVPASFEIEDFFERHAYLPQGVCTPPDSTQWEIDRGAPPPSETADSSGTEAGADDALELPEIESDGFFIVADDDIYDHPHSIDAQIEDFVHALDLAAELQRLAAAEDAGWPVGMSPDVIAYYRAWHWQGNERWGIVIRGREFLKATCRLIAGVRRRGGRTPDIYAVSAQLADLVLTHELFHLRTELAATHLETLMGRSLYREHQLSRSLTPNPWTSGSIEELLATYSETCTSGIHSDVMVSWLEMLDSAPAGYAEWHQAHDDRVRPLIFARHATDIAGTPFPDLPGPEPTQDELAGVRRWWDDAATFGFAQQIFGRPRVPRHP